LNFRNEFQHGVKIGGTSRTVKVKVGGIEFDYQTGSKELHTKIDRVKQERELQKHLTSEQRADLAELRTKAGVEVSKNYPKTRKVA
jgi:hypothetical protein